MSKHLKTAIVQMEITRTTTDPVRELRHWRLAAQQRVMGAVAEAAKAAPARPEPKKGQRR